MSNNPSEAEENDFFIAPQAIEPKVALEVMQQGELTLHGLMPWSSNYTFLGTVAQDSIKFNVIYKPSQGERPLWDFDEGSLCRREVASYLVSCALGGWPAIPPTVLCNGPHGEGSLQQFIHADYEIHYFTLNKEHCYQATFKEFAVFDYLVNNADRKGGHCLMGPDDKIWAIDHGLTFHVEPKLRTVIWEYANQDIPANLLKSLQTFKESFIPSSELYQQLSKLLSTYEIERFYQRLDTLLQSGKFPRPMGMRDYPYPPI